MSTVPIVAACMKWTARPGEPRTDERFAGVSEADRSALEVALRLGERLGIDVVAVAVGPAGADVALRDAIGCGAARAIRVDAPDAMTSAEVARQLSRHLVDAVAVVCGDHSTDRGSGSVPAFLAHRLGVAQALGLVAVEVDALDAAASSVGAVGAVRAVGAVGAVRRLDGGRREVLSVPLPAVLSVEGGVAPLRRAGLRAALAARGATIETAKVAPYATHAATPVVTPFRPRARVLAAPAGDDVLGRLRQLTDAGAATQRGETVVLDPPAAAARIVEALRSWGYLA